MKHHLFIQNVSVTLAGLLLGLVSGCSPASEGGGAPNAGGDSGADEVSSAGAATASSNNGLCGLPGASVVLPGGNIKGTVGLTTLAADDTTLFVGSYYSIAAIPLQGGTPKVVYTPAEPLPAFYDFWLRGDNLVVWHWEGLDVLPKGGGTVKTLDLGSLYTEGHIDADGGAFYAVKDYPKGGDYLARLGDRTWWRFDAKSGETLQLAAEKSLGYEESYKVVGDYLYVVQATGTGKSDDSTPDRLFRMPTKGGPAEEVPVEGAFHMELAGARGDDLYFIGSTKPEQDAVDNLAIYKLPTAGGTPAMVIDHEGLKPSRTQFSTSFTAFADRDVLCFAGDCFDLPAHGAARHLTGSGCITGAVLPTEDAIFLVADGVGETIRVLRVPYE